MRASVPAADTAHVSRRVMVLFVGASILLFGVIGGGVFYVSTEPSKIERIVGCAQEWAYDTSVFHDDGRELFDPGLTGLPFGEVQVRPPSNQLTVIFHDGNLAVVTIPDNGGASKIAVTSGPLKAGERVAVTDCAA